MVGKHVARCIILNETSCLIFTRTFNFTTSKCTRGSSIFSQSVFWVKSAQTTHQHHNHNQPSLDSVFYFTLLLVNVSHLLASDKTQRIPQVSRQLCERYTHGDIVPNVLGQLLSFRNSFLDSWTRYHCRSLLWIWQIFVLCWVLIFNQPAETATSQ